MADLFAPVVSITTTKRRRFFWAAWWAAPPAHTPFRKPDAANGGARTREEALQEAERKAGRQLVEIEPHWARAWSRMLRGEEPWLARPRSEDERVFAAQTSVERAEGEQRTSIWTVLGIPPRSPLAEIKRAYRSRALETHPDRGGDAELFRRVQRAYEQAVLRSRRSTRRGQ